MAVRLFRPWLTEGDDVMRIILRSDNTATIQAALKYKASSPLMLQLTVELMLELESLQINHVVPQHVAGQLNYVADALSRLSHRNEIPQCLKQSIAVDVPPRPASFYRAWPQ